MGGTPWMAIWRSRERSARCWTVVRQGWPCAIFGIVDDGYAGSTKVGIVWMVATNQIHHFRRLFIQECPGWHHRLTEGYGLTWNVVDCRNTVHVRWLRWLGYSFLRRHKKFGPERRPFFEFAKVIV